MANVTVLGVISTKLFPLQINRVFSSFWHFVGTSIYSGHTVLQMQISSKYSNVIGFPLSHPVPIPRSRVTFVSNMPQRSGNIHET